MTNVKVNAGSRLHFGLLCGAPDSGWHYGGIGLMVDQPAWSLRVSVSNGTTDIFDTSAAVSERLKNLLADFRNGYDSLPAVRVSTSTEVGFHSGLGSGTQLTLAVGTALLLLSGRPRPASVAELAAAFGRSRRSAIGTYGFDRGGFIVDHGKSADGNQISMERIRFPDAWRFVIVTPPQNVGLSGDTEEAFFRNQQYLSASTIQLVESLINAQISPAVANGDFDSFRDSLAAYGDLVGSYYGPTQGGIYSSDAIQELADWLKQQGVSGAVQSSWGPSACIPASSQEHANEIADRIRSCPSQTTFDVQIARGLNTGATIRTAAPEHQRSFG